AVWCSWTGSPPWPPRVRGGYSDATAVLEAVGRRLGWASLLSPMVESGGPFAHYSFGSMLRTLMHPERAMTISYEQGITMVGGARSGITLGGCLTLLTSSIGTDSSWPARGGILLIEEGSEEDDRLDRMLTQLRTP